MTALTDHAPCMATGVPAGRLLLGGGDNAVIREHRRIFGASPIDLTAEQLDVAIQEAGLRSRGGSWFPTADKLAAVSVAGSWRRRPVAVANGMEGEPLSAKDASLMSHSPHLVLEGISFAVEVLRAQEALLAVHSNSLVIPILAAALREREQSVPENVGIRLQTG
jgi:NADH:ubiquinone oxidoreductase subunit F (NADH-binding)